MEMVHCPNCNAVTGHKRALGFGTFFARGQKVDGSI